jgi:V8-like Glu-specific endopeptidase
LRRLTLAPALLAALALAGPAEARVEQKSVSESASSVKSHWTADRMRSAKPAEQRFGGTAAGKGKKGALPWTSEEITTPYTQAPTSTHGKVFFTLGGNDYVCSGTALLSSNKSVVWTAGHCVNEGPGAFATNWQFVPAYKDGSAPLGVYTAEDLLAPSAWARSGDFSYDLGAAVVGPASGTALTDRVGGRGIAFNYNRSQSFQSYGYPAAPPFTGERLWRCSSPLQTSDNSANPATLGIGCDMTGGSSGGGWIVGSSVYSVNSYGYNNQPDVMYGPYQGNVAQSLYNAAAAA